MYKIDKHKIVSNLRTIQYNLNYIKDQNITSENQINNKENLTLYYAVSLALFNIVNKVIDLGEDLIDSLDKNIYPRTYKEIPEILLKNKIINDKQFKTFKEFIEYRNEIAHEYENITSPEIFWCLQKLDFIKEFMKIIKKNLL